MAIGSEITEHSYEPGAAMAAEALTGIVFFDADDLVVELWLDGASVASAVLDRDADYTIAGDGTVAAGTITSLAEYAAGDEFRIRRESAALQREVLPKYQDLSAKDIERGLDAGVLHDQEQDREMARSPKFPRASVTYDFADLATLTDGGFLTRSGATIAPFAHAPFAGKVYGGSAFTGLPTPLVVTDPGGLDTLASLALATGPQLVGTPFDLDLDGLLDGSVSIDARATADAAGLEALAAAHPVLKGVAGATHTVETAPFVQADSFTLDGNGAILRNTNATALNIDDSPSAVMFLGTSNLLDSNRLTFHAVSAVNGRVLTSVGNGHLFAAGAKVVLRGAAFYTVTWPIFTNKILATVVASTADTIELDKVPPSQLVGDTPEIANADEGISSAFSGAPQYYLVHRPQVYRAVFKSDVGPALDLYGVIDGRFRDIVTIGRNGIGANPAQDTLFDGISFQSWRKIGELAEGSYGSTIRFMRGSLTDASTKRGGGSDVPTFFMGIHENSAECVLDDWNVSSGPNDAAGGGNACQLGAGRNNEIRNSILRFPAQTHTALAVQSNTTAPGASNDNGYRNVTVFAPVCSRFFAITDAGGGIARPYLVDVKCFGAPTLQAGFIAGSEGLLDNVWCQAGALAFVGTPTNWTVRNCYFPGGFTSMTAALLQANNFHDNQSDASRRLNVAAIIVSAQASVVTTVANTSYKTAIFAAGDLASLDRVFVSTIARTAGTAGNKNGRLTITVAGVETALATALQGATAGDPLGFEAELWIQGNTAIGYKVRYFASAKTVIEEEGVVAVASLALNALTVDVEYWLDNAADAIVTQGCRMIPVKPGMRSLPVK